MSQDLHSELDALATDALLGAFGEELEAHSSGGCSRCARVLVNARDLGATLAASAPEARVDPAMRARVLSDAWRARPASIGSQPAAAHVLDPSSAVARLHLRAGDEAARSREILELGARSPREGDGLGRLLAQLQALLGFPLQLVTIVDGDRVVYRAERGLPAELAALGGVPRASSFCTHCVSCGGPLVVEDAAREAFFRSSQMVARFGIAAYVGVPLRDGEGPILGTLCGFDVAPRRIPSGDLRVMELLARRASAELAWPRTELPRAALVEPGDAEICAEAWFAELLGAIRDRHPARSPVAMISAPRAEPAAARAFSRLARPEEIVGRAGQGVSLLVPRAGAASGPPATHAPLAQRDFESAVGQRLRELAAALPGLELRSSLGPVGGHV